MKPALALPASLLLAVTAPGLAGDPCPEEGPLQNWTGAGEVVCPCFAVGEEAGAVLNLPASEFPIEILRVGIGWGSLFAGNPDQLEAAIHIYGAGLPNPGAPLFTLRGPQLTDGVINEFDLEPLLGEIIIDEGPFTVTLEFDNANAGDQFASSVVHDDNGCQAGKNVVFVPPASWFNACALGVTGDWIFHVVYRSATCSLDPAGAVPDGDTVPGNLLTVERLGNNLLLTWDPSCSAGDTDYEVYEGVVGNFASYALKDCSTGGATATVVVPGAGNRFYLVVPTNGVAEGSHGLDSAGNERGTTGAACPLPQSLGACPP